MNGGLTVSGHPRIYRYCAWASLAKAIQLGWLVCALNEPWGILCCWLCDCPAPWPSDPEDGAGGSDGRG